MTLCCRGEAVAQWRARARRPAHATSLTPTPPSCWLAQLFFGRSSARYSAVSRPAKPAGQEGAAGAGTGAGAPAGAAATNGAEAPGAPPCRAERGRAAGRGEVVTLQLTPAQLRAVANATAEFLKTSEAGSGGGRGDGGGGGGLVELVIRPRTAQVRAPAAAVPP